MTLYCDVLGQTALEGLFDYCILAITILLYGELS
jgi:hypothetical protein